MSNSTTRIGFIGLGVMGMGMARNLLKAGFPLTVCNRSPAKVQTLVSEGAIDGGSPAGVARASEIILTCVPDTPDVEKVLFGPSGVVEGASPGAIIIDLSTISATAVVAFAERLQKHGLSLLDSPVSGGQKGAENGTLSCMVGGSTEDFARCQPVFQAIGKTILHLGPVGSGQVVKACNQIAACATLLGISEAIALCQKTGTDPRKMCEALAGGSANSFVLQNHAKRLLDGQLQPGFRAALMLKDLKLAMITGVEAGSFMPVSALGTQMFTALCATGRDQLDSSSVGLLFQELSGSTSRSH